MNNEEFKALIPSVILHDEKIGPLVQVIANALSAQYPAIKKAGIYGRINELPEDLIGILAKDFKVDWITQDMSLDEKRSTLQNSWYVHRKLGTKGAVDRALSSIYTGYVIKEWFEYNAEPYHFKIVINSDTDRMSGYDRLKAITDKVKYYKNVRSAFDGVEFIANDRTQQYIGMAVRDGNTLTASNMPWCDPDELTWYLDEYDNILFDDIGMVLFD